MALTAGHVASIVALIGGILILLVPRLLNYIAAIRLDQAQWDLPFRILRNIASASLERRMSRPLCGSRLNILHV